MRYLLFLIFGSSLFAMPAGVISDPITVRIEREADVMRLVAPDRSVLEWSSFSIKEGEKVEFILPNSNAAVLNRVVGSNPSEILGEMRSNGQIVLINPNGIFFGKNSSVDVGSLLASTLDLTNNDFKMGMAWNFQGDSRMSVVNKGKILAWTGDLFFIGHTTENHGLIKGTDVGMFACEEFTLQLSGSDRISLTLHEFNPSSIFSQEVPSRAVQLGKMKARGTVEDGGGEVYLFGHQIIVQNYAAITAVHPLDGGKIWIGADLRGASGPLESSKNIYIAPNVIIDACSTQSGNGGTVVLWADRDMIFSGSISCRPGPMGGTDGNVTLFGGIRLENNGTVNISAPVEIPPGFSPFGP